MPITQTESQLVGLMQIAKDLADEDSFDDSEQKAKAVVNIYLLLVNPKQHQDVKRAEFSL